MNSTPFKYDDINKFNENHHNYSNNYYDRINIKNIDNKEKNCEFKDELFSPQPQLHQYLHQQQLQQQQNFLLNCQNQRLEQLQQQLLSLQKEKQNNVEIYHSLNNNNNKDNADNKENSFNVNYKDEFVSNDEKSNYYSDNNDVKVKDMDNIFFKLVISTNKIIKHIAKECGIIFDFDTFCVNTASKKLLATSTVFKFKINKNAIFFDLFNQVPIEVVMGHFYDAINYINSILSAPVVIAGEMTSSLSPISSIFSSLSTLLQVFTYLYDNLNNKINDCKAGVRDDIIQNYLQFYLRQNKIANKQINNINNKDNIPLRHHLTPKSYNMHNIYIIDNENNINLARKSVYEIDVVVSLKSFFYKNDNENNDKTNGVFNDNKMEFNQMELQLQKLKKQLQNQNLQKFTVLAPNTTNATATNAIKRNRETKIGYSIDPSNSKTTNVDFNLTPSQVIALTSDFSFDRRNNTVAERRVSTTVPKYTPVNNLFYYEQVKNIDENNKFEKQIENVSHQLRVLRAVNELFSPNKRIQREISVQPQKKPRPSNIQTINDEKNLILSDTCANTLYLCEKRLSTDNSISSTSTITSTNSYNNINYDNVINRDDDKEHVRTSSSSIDSQSKLLTEEVINDEKKIKQISDKKTSEEEKISSKLSSTSELESKEPPNSSNFSDNNSEEIKFLLEAQQRQQQQLQQLMETISSVYDRKNMDQNYQDNKDIEKDKIINEKNESFQLNTPPATVQNEAEEEKVVIISSSSNKNWLSSQRSESLEEPSLQEEQRLQQLLKQEKNLQQQYKLQEQKIQNQQQELEGQKRHLQVQLEEQKMELQRQVQEYQQQQQQEQKKLEERLQQKLEQLQLQNRQELSQPTTLISSPDSQNSTHQQQKEQSLTAPLSSNGVTSIPSFNITDNNDNLASDSASNNALLPSSRVIELQLPLQQEQHLHQKKIEQHQRQMEDEQLQKEERQLKEQQLMLEEKQNQQPEKDSSVVKLFFPSSQEQELQSEVQKLKDLLKKKIEEEFKSQQQNSQHTFSSTALPLIPSSFSQSVKTEKTVPSDFAKDVDNDNRDGGNALDKFNKRFITTPKVEHNVEEGFNNRSSFEESAIDQPSGNFNDKDFNNYYDSEDYYDNLIGNLYKKRLCPNDDNHNNSNLEITASDVNLDNSSFSKGQLHAKIRQLLADNAVLSFHSQVDFQQQLLYQQQQQKQIEMIERQLLEQQLQIQQQEQKAMMDKENKKECKTVTDKADEGQNGQQQFQPPQNQQQQSYEAPPLLTSPSGRSLQQRAFRSSIVFSSFSNDFNNPQPSSDFSTSEKYPASPLPKLPTTLKQIENNNDRDIKNVNMENRSFSTVTTSSFTSTITSTNGKSKNSKESEKDDMTKSRDENAMEKDLIKNSSEQSLISSALETQRQLQQQTPVIDPRLKVPKRSSSSFFCCGSTNNRDNKGQETEKKIDKKEGKDKIVKEGNNKN